MAGTFFYTYIVIYDIKIALPRNRGELWGSACKRLERSTMRLTLWRYSYIDKFTKRLYGTIAAL